MSLFTTYLNKQRSLPLTEAIAVNSPNLIVVIPCFNEPELPRTIRSLYACENIDSFRTEIIVLINSYSHPPGNIVRQNCLSYDLLLQLVEESPRSIHLVPILLEQLPEKQAGVGLARKLGMDEAVRRFQRSGSSSGVIVSLDADCTVDPNYLSELYTAFSSDSRLFSATIRFHHPVSHLPEDNPVRKASLVYENYLLYYQEALFYTDYPYPYFTIGSAFAVRADVYAGSGGMGKQQAGEDFYFLQKVFPLGKSRFIDTTTVYPAARLSDRVPFGTGPALDRMIAEGKYEKQTYTVDSFRLLKRLFSDLNSFYKQDREFIEQKIIVYPPAMKDFLISDDFLGNMLEINRHTATLKAFRKRFFNYFNAFKILKYLNFVHPDYFEWEDASKSRKILAEEISLLQHQADMDISG